MKSWVVLSLVNLTALGAVPVAAQAPVQAERLSRPVPQAAAAVRPAVPRSQKPSQKWIAAITDGIYFREGCDAALRLASTNRRLFPSRIAAEAAGYRRSKAPGC
jgi:hypothetical protein